jgi:hypothetical protein
MRHLAWNGVLAIVASSVGLSALAQDGGGGPPPMEATIRTMWRQAHKFPDLRDLVINWRYESAYVPATEKLEALRFRAKADPTSRMTDELTEYERRQREGTPLVRHLSIRARSDRQWRLCQNSPGARVEFIDYVLSEDAAWKLTPEWLVLIDPRHPMPEGHPIPDVGAFFFSDLFMMLDGGLRNSALVGTDLTSTAPFGDRWRCEVANDAGSLRREFHLRWDAAAQRLLVDRMIATSGPDAGHRWELREWTAHAEAGIWLAQRAEKYAPDGQLEYALVVERVEREPPGRFEEVVRAPDFDVPDALRGAVSLKSITDYRTEPPQEVIRTSRGIERSSLALVAQISERGERTYRRLGWGLAGLTVVVCVFLFVRLRPMPGAARTSKPL